MFENIANFFKKLIKTESKQTTHSKDTAKERLHLVLMQDRANVSADFLELMKQEIIEVIKKYIEVEESAIDVRLTNEIGEDGSKGAPSLYANIPILNIKNDIKKENTDNKQKNKDEKQEEDKSSDKTSEETIDSKEENKKEDKNEKIEKVESESPEEIKKEEDKEAKENKETEEIIEKVKDEEETKESINKLKEEENKSATNDTVSKSN